MSKRFTIVLPFFLFIVSTLHCLGQSHIISTCGGNGISGFNGDGGPASAAVFYQPSGIAIDEEGNKYICDLKRIRKIDSSGITSTIAGNGLDGYSGDGGPAINAQFSSPTGLALDAAGNVYVADRLNNRIRKITTAGIITTFAGNGGDSSSGDGGPATAASIFSPFGVAADLYGNVYIPDGNNRIRKVNTAGIITTAAGNGAGTSTGDGGPATDATVYGPQYIAIDPSNNIYISEGVGRIRKIDTTGIITTIAGNGNYAYTGDGGPATDAAFFSLAGIAVDSIGNVYAGHWESNVVRKIDRSGIITTIAGTGLPGHSGDGGPAYLAQLGSPNGLAIDRHGDLYIADETSYIRKFSILPMMNSDSFSVDFSTPCDGLNFSITTKTYHAGLSICTYFGDGTSVVFPINPGYAATRGFASFSHAYPNSGTYTIKHVLMSSAAGPAIDSITYSAPYTSCNSMEIRYYLDKNTNCLFDEGVDIPLYLPVTTEIDSNGIPLDTIVTPNGFYYKAYANTGDIYTFKILPPPGLSTTCSTSGIIYDTIQPTSYSSRKYINVGFACSTGNDFDLSTSFVSLAGRHAFGATMLVNNLFCAPVDATLTVNFSPKYTFSGANIPPSSISGNTLTWNFNNFSTVFSGPRFLYFTAEKGSLPYYVMGDTAFASYKITPMPGDMDTMNNYGIVIDTVSSSFDPNFIEVAPAGCIPHTAIDLSYTIGFENTGNDTAYNIYVLDTLPQGLDISSLKITSGSAYMIFTKIKYGAQIILKFDFPGIMLPDSSHHNLCNGILNYHIKTKDGLVDASILRNRCGIYFDTNPVVMTNEAINTINCPTKETPKGIGEISLYPSPASNTLFLATDSTSYNVYHIADQLSNTLNTGKLSGNLTEINISDLPPGLYFLSVSGTHGRSVKKFIKL